MRCQGREFVWHFLGAPPTGGPHRRGRRKEYVSTRYCGCQSLCDHILWFSTFVDAAVDTSREMVISVEIENSDRRGRAHGDTRRALSGPNPLKTAATISS